MQAVDLPLDFFLELRDSRFRSRCNIDYQKVGALCQIEGECRGIRSYLSLAHEGSVQPASISQAENRGRNAGSVVLLAAEHGERKAMNSRGRLTLS